MAEADDGDLRAGPLFKRCTDSRWKARMYAYEELAGELEKAAPEDKIYEVCFLGCALFPRFFLFSDFFSPWKRPIYLAGHVVHGRE